jgi:hypothetical protein
MHKSSNLLNYFLFSEAIVNGIVCKDSVLRSGNSTCTNFIFLGEVYFLIPNVFLLLRDFVFLSPRALLIYEHNLFYLFFWIY